MADEDAVAGDEVLDPQLIGALRKFLNEELTELRADVGEHDRTLMDLLRGRPLWARASSNGTLSPQEKMLSVIDTAATALERLDAEGGEDGSRLKTWERLLKLAPATRQLIAELLCIPSGDERAALDFCIAVDDEQRREALSEIELAEVRGLEAASAPVEETV